MRHGRVRGVRPGERRRDARQADFGSAGGGAGRGVVREATAIGRPAGPIKKKASPSAAEKKRGGYGGPRCTCKMKVDTHKSVGVYFFRSKIREKGGIGMGKKGTPHRKWSKEEKLYYIHLHLDEHLSVMEIERRHGVRNSLVSAWVKRYLEEGEDALEPKNGNPYAALHTSKTLSEVDRLRLIIAKQEVEIARLKKGYWVEGVGAKKEYVTGSGKNTKSSKN